MDGIKRGAKIGFVLLLMCVVVLECAYLVPLKLTTLGIDSVPPEYKVPASASYLVLNGTDGLSGVASKLIPHQQAYQEQSTEAVATYIEETSATEELRLQRAREKAEARQKFFEEQQELARKYEELLKEQQANQPQYSLNDPDSIVNNPGIYAVGPGSSLNNPSYVVPTTPSGSGSFDGFVSGDLGNNGAAGNLDMGSNYVPNTPGSGLNDNERPADNVLDPAVVDTYVPDSDSTPDNYCGEFIVTLVCTCPNCFNPTLWPESKLSDSFILADPAFLAPGIQVQLTSKEFGTYSVHDADGRVTGRELILFHGSHGIGPESNVLFAKVYNVSH